MWVWRRVGGGSRGRGRRIGGRRDAVLRLRGPLLPGPNKGSTVRLQPGRHGDTNQSDSWRSGGGGAGGLSPRPVAGAAHAQSTAAPGGAQVETTWAREHQSEAPARP